MCTYKRWYRIGLAHSVSRAREPWKLKLFYLNTRQTTVALAASSLQPRFKLSAQLPNTCSVKSPRTRRNTLSRFLKAPHSIPRLGRRSYHISLQAKLIKRVSSNDLVGFIMKITARRVLLAIENHDKQPILTPSPLGILIPEGDHITAVLI